MKCIKSITKSASIYLLLLATTICFTACGSQQSIETNGDGSKGITADKGALVGFDGAVADVGGEGIKSEGVAEYEGEYNGEAPDEPLIDSEEPLVDSEESIIDSDEQLIETDSDKIGMLTAGEWNDHNNWGFFKNLIDTKTIELPNFCLDISNRIKVNVKNTVGEPIPNERVFLYGDDDSTIWSAVTDKNGVAYLFEFEVDTARKVVSSTGAEAEISKLETDTQSTDAKVSDREVELVIDSEPTAYANMQIQFIVDTTGSMGDEMLYLQSDFRAIAEEVGTDNKEFSTVFYRDTSDDYVVKSNDFTSVIEDITSQLGNESADGGGDLPEAVSEALDSAFNELSWQDETVKIAFLIFDAPPHEDEASIEKLNNAIRNASDKGIKVVPIVSSNSQRETELFGRTLAIATNGTYVFLTDDSGIGGSHLEPIIGDYEVEKLHDIIVRLINDYSQSGD